MESGDSMTEESIESLIARLDCARENMIRSGKENESFYRHWPRISTELKRLQNENERALLQSETPAHLVATTAEWTYALQKIAVERDEIRALMEDVRSRVMPGEIDSSDAMLQIKRERDELRAYKIAAIAELTVARERLGPAGYKIIREAAQSRKIIEVLTEALRKYEGLTFIGGCEGGIYNVSLGTFEHKKISEWSLKGVAGEALKEAERLRGEIK